MPKVALVDDHALLRNALASIIQSFEGYEVSFLADNGKHLIDLIQQGNIPDIVIMDVTMPIMNGYETTQWLTLNRPEIKVVALSMLKDERVVIRMLRSGARGYLLKDGELEEIQMGLQEVMNKGIFINDILYRNIVDTLQPAKLEEHKELERKVASELAEREREFLQLLCSAELTYREIADAMCLSPRTVDGYRDNLFEKLQVHSRVGLVLFAFRNDIATIPIFTERQKENPLPAEGFKIS